MLTAEMTKAEALGRLRAEPDKIRKAARNAAAYVLSIARRNAPKKSGALRQGIVLSPFAEHTKYQGKAVYDVYFDEKTNDTFVKYSKAGKRYYYPASQEYGFRSETRAGEKRIRGKYFMYAASRAGRGRAEEITQRMIEDVFSEP